MKKTLTFALILLITAMILCPQATYAGSNYALHIWYQSVLPSLLPFFICSQLLIDLGAIKTIGKWLTPIIQPLFYLPGASGIAIIMGFTSGFPTGAVIAANLRENNLCTQEQGERLISFCNNPSLGFLTISIATGLLTAPQWGLFLVAINYGTNLCVGIILGLIARIKKQPLQNNQTLHSSSENIPLGILLKNATMKAISNVVLIAGYMIFFSVLIQIIKAINLLPLLSSPLDAIIKRPLGEDIITGICEMTIGIQGITAAPISLQEQIQFILILLAWGGLSVHAQISGLITYTDIKMKTYFFSRAMQIILSIIAIKIFLPLTTIETIGLIQPLTALKPQLFLPISLFILIFTCLQGAIILRIKKLFNHD